jgi:hypothetical protein
VQPAGAAQSLLCTLEVQVLLPKPSRRGGSASSWVTVWQCQVLFTDDAARIRELKVSSRIAVIILLLRVTGGVAACISHDAS